MVHTIIKYNNLKDNIVKTLTKSMLIRPRIAQKATGAYFHWGPFKITAQREDRNN
jgi:stalled ribosome alternative rescue factor ArfA